MSLYPSTDVSHKIQGNSTIGGLIGLNVGKATHSFTDVKVFGVGYAGGHTGENRGEVIQSFAAGDVETTHSYTGGLIGYSYWSAIVLNAYAAGSVTGSGYVGGLIGLADGIVTNTYASGFVSSGDTFDFGGLAGYNFGDIISSYHYQGPNNGHGILKREAEMKQRTTFSGWIFEGEGSEEIWQIDEGKSFPTLLWFERF